jgi:hypothetical protein
MIEVIAPDGTIVRFPEGTPQETIISVMRAQFGGPEQNATGFPAEPTGGSAVNRENLDAASGALSRAADGFAAGLMNGATLGFMDEARAGVVGGLMGGVPDGESRVDFFNYDVPFSERFEGLANQQRARMDQASEAAPFASGLGNVAGAVGPGALAAIRFLPGAGASLLQNVGAGAGIGAAEGALTGLGNADGQDPVSAATFGTIAGAALGGIAPAAQAGLRAAGDVLGGAFRGAFDIPSEALAARNVARVVNRSGQSVDDLQRALDQAVYDGQEMFILADALGRPGQRALSGVARQPGAGAREIADYLDRRQDNQGNRLFSFFREAMDTNDTPRIREARTRQERRLDAGVNYDAAREQATPVDVRGALEEIDSRIGPMQGMGVDLDPIDDRMLRIRNQLAAPSNRLPEGMQSVELSDFGRVLEIKSRLSAQLRSGQLDGHEAMLLRNVERRLDEALEQASSGYRVANDRYRQQSQAIEAIETGQEAAGRMQTEDALNLLRSVPNNPVQTSGTDVVPFGFQFPINPQDGFRTGYADRFLTNIQTNIAPTSNLARQFRSDKDEALINALAGDPDLWNRRLQREMDMHATQHRALGGSMTNDNMQDSADMAGGAANMLNFANSVRSGGLIGGTATVADKLSTLASGTNEATRNLIAQALLSRDPQAALAPLLRSAQRSTGFDRTVEALMRAGGYQALGVN